MITPLRLMWDRIERGKADSDTSFFLDLLYAGEMVLKITVAALVASVEEDREGHRYRLSHKLVRADGLGDWSQCLDDLLTGPASQHVRQEAKESRRILTERVAPDTWQYKAVAHLHTVLEKVTPDIEPLPARVALRTWFSKFVELRNKTRAHGAPTAALCASVCPALETSIKTLCENHPLFNRQWAYLHRNISGKYRVVSLGTDTASFDSLRTSEGVKSYGKNLSDGIYVYFGAPIKIDLIETTVDVTDFYFPNGAFTSKGFELHSLITDSRKEADAGPYLAPAGERAPSETEGIGQLDVIGNVFGNLPPSPKDYVARPALEQDLSSTLKNDRHPIVTLVGLGGIGKTSLALRVLHDLSKEQRFDMILWFSARDIDLLASGPKIVRPHVLTETDIANEFVRLIEPTDASQKDFKATTFLAESLRKANGTARCCSSSIISRPSEVRLIYLIGSMATSGYPIKF